MRIRPRLALSERMRRVCGALGLLGLLATGLVIAVGAAGGRTFEVPAIRAVPPDWIRGPFGSLDFTITGAQFLLVLLAMCGAYGLVLIAGQAVPARLAVGSIVLLHLIFIVAPPLLSKDIFSYLEYARLGVIHHVNPYGIHVRAFVHDPVYRYLGWKSVASAYGPLFTIASYPLAHMSSATGLWIIKVLTGLASLGCVALVWDSTRRLGRNPVPAVLFYGLNPVLLVFAVGGGHNDILMVLLGLAGVAYMLRGREGAGTFAVVCGGAIKASIGVMIPFMVLASRDRRRAIVGTVVALALMGAIAVIGFGSHALGVFRVLSHQQRLVSSDAIPAQIGRAVTLGGVTSDVRLVSRLLLLGSICWLLWLVWRRGYDWIAACGWALLGLVVGSSWLLGWYVIWPLPFAAIANDKRLRVAALAFTLYFVAMRWPIIALGEG
ncbi:MAG: DUF2029 domain-containing protein [Actinobacteria bacterium]|nr:DUF2029 domain-containing protein [Actinomycetota bacterium]